MLYLTTKALLEYNYIGTIKLSSLLISGMFRSNSYLTQLRTLFAIHLVILATPKNMQNRSLFVVESCVTRMR